MMGPLNELSRSGRGSKAYSQLAWWCVVQVGWTVGAPGLRRKQEMRREWGKETRVGECREH